MASRGASYSKWGKLFQDVLLCICPRLLSHATVDGFWVRLSCGIPRFGGMGVVYSVALWRRSVIMTMFLLLKESIGEKLSQCLGAKTFAAALGIARRASVVEYIRTRARATSRGDRDHPDAQC